MMTVLSLEACLMDCKEREARSSIGGFPIKCSGRFRNFSKVSQLAKRAYHPCLKRGTFLSRKIKFDFLNTQQHQHRAYRSHPLSTERIGQMRCGIPDEQMPIRGTYCL